MDRRHFLPILAAAVALALFGLAGCAELKTDLPAPVSPGVNVHPEGVTEPSSPDWHGNAIRANNWDLRECQKCHGVDYAGGTAGTSCNDCHTAPGGPENCSTCHGTTNPAPPRDLKGNTSRTAVGVGAHQAHVAYAGGLCVGCHVTPGENLFGYPHMNDGTTAAEVVFGGLAYKRTNVPGGQYYTSSVPTVTPNPVWNGTRCSNVYCHGAFKNGNRANSPTWADTTNASDFCGTCHGAPPVGTHPLNNACSTCHTGVVNTAGQIIDRTKHINGKLNVFGEEYSTW